MSSLKPDQIIRSKRKTIALIIEGDGRLIVRAPFNTSDYEILCLVKKKANWIKTKKAIVTQNKSINQPKDFVDDEKFFFLGNQYPLKIVNRQRKSLELHNGYFQLRSSSSIDPRKTFENWYRDQARKIITERVDYHANQQGLRYKRIRITGARTRWGSCGAGGSLNFTWRLVMAPIDIIDYVVIHELAHIRIPGHNRKFWNLVQDWQPDYRDRKRWLNEYGGQLTL